MPGFVKTPKDEAKWESAKEAAGKTKGGKQRWALANYIYHKCEVAPELAKSESYTPLVFRNTKKKDAQGEKLDFPSTSSDPFKLRDTKMPEFPSTPGTGEAYAQAFQTVGNSAPQGIPSYQPGNFKGEHGPDIQYKGTDHVPVDVKKKLQRSVIIAGKKVIVKGKPVGEYTKDYPGAKVTFNQPIDSNKKPSKVFVHLTEEGRDIKAKRSTQKSVKKLVLQYTQNQPLAACFKPLVAYLVNDDPEDEDNSLKVTTFGKKHVGKAMTGEPTAKQTTGTIAEKIAKYPSKGPASSSRLRLMERASEEAKELAGDVNAHDEAGAIHPGVDYKALNRKSMNKGGFKDKWIKQQESKGKDPLKVPGKNDKLDNVVDFRTSFRDRKTDEIDETWARARKAAHDPVDSKKSFTSTSLRKDLDDARNVKEIEIELDKKVEKPIEVTKQYPVTNPVKNRDAYLPGGAEITRSSRPNPIEGGEGDDLDYKDVDEKELESGIEVEKEHVGKNKEMDDDEKKVAAADIAMDHLKELPDYYKRLDEMERQGKENLKQESKKRKLLRTVGKSIIVKKGKDDTLRGAVGLHIAAHNPQAASVMGKDAKEKAATDLREARIKEQLRLRKEKVDKSNKIFKSFEIWKKWKKQKGSR